MLGGDHTWPGAPLAFPGTNYDIDASRVIWEFLSQYDLNGKRESTPTEELTTLQTEIQVYPNPTHSQVSLTGLSKGNSAYQVISVDGRVLLTGTTQNATIDLSLLSPNLYFIQVNDIVLKVLKIE